jgi:hypothetical protein
MADKYNPQSLKEDAIIKKTILDTAVDVQSALQLLISKDLITIEELNQMREKVKNLPKYKASYEVINKINNAANLYENDPQAYLKALFEEKLNGR